MTWIVGTPTLFGYGLILGDIQATLTYSDGKIFYEDCLCKIYPVSKSYVAGFAGSIRLGFYLIEDLKKDLYEPDPNREFNPEIFLNYHYQRRLRWLYKNLKPEFKTPEHRVDLLIIAIHPTLNDTDGGKTGNPKPFGYILRSPSFVPEPIPWGKLGSIGSGSDEKAYKSVIDDINSELYNPLMQFEVGQPQGYGQILATHIRGRVVENPKSGISKFFINGFVTRGNVSLGINLFNTVDASGKYIRENEPKVATSWEEFSKMMKAKGHNLANAHANG